MSAKTLYARVSLWESGRMDVVELLGLDSLLGAMVLALGAAMVLGNGFAIYQNHRGRRPAKETGEFRAGRAWWLFGVGVLITIWGVASSARRVRPLRARGRERICPRCRLTTGDTYHRSLRRGRSRT